MVSKALPEAYLRKYQHAIFHIQAVSSPGNSFSFPSLLLFHGLQPIWTCHGICFSYSFISFMWSIESVSRVKHIGIILVGMVLQFYRIEVVLVSYYGFIMASVCFCYLTNISACFNSCKLCWCFVFKSDQNQSVVYLSLMTAFQYFY